MSDVPDHVRAWASRPGARALLSLAREKVETGRSGPRTRLEVGAEHRADVGRMFGVTWELSGKAVTLRALREKLDGSGTSLEALLVEVGGPLRNAAVEKAQAQTQEVEQRAHLTGVLTGAGLPAPVATMALRWLGPAARVEETADLVVRAWEALPVRPGTAPEGSSARLDGLAEFAGRVLGDPHALDRNTHAGRTLARSIAATLASTDEANPSGSTEEWGVVRCEAARVAAADAVTARQWRAAWAAVGVQCDQVSSMVLVMNLPLTGPNPALGQVTSVAGEPLWVTSRMTSVGCSVAEASGDGELVVRVCENPSVMEAAAAELGAGCPPLVCLYGRPSGAAWDVLTAVVSAGGRVLLSGDRDTAGTQIVEDVAGAFSAGRVVGWLPEVDGLYEEQRLPALLADLHR